MRELNVRTFSRNVHKELLDLPITLTKYGKSFAVISSPNVQTNVQTNVRQSKNVSKKASNSGRTDTLAQLRKDVANIERGVPVEKPKNVSTPKRTKKIKKTGWQAGHFGTG